MRALILIFMATCVDAGILDSSEIENKQSITEDGFEERLRKGYNLLKNEPNEDDTVRFLEKLHNMEKEMRGGHVISQQQSDLSSGMENYAEIEANHIQPMGDTIEEVNHNSNVDTALFQGDIILTKEQADEIMEDIKEGIRGKRQAARDRRYPRYVWTKGVYYSFHSNATNVTKQVFRKAAKIWQRETCIDFSENDTAPDRIVVFKESGCWSHMGKKGGVQGLSLGNGCNSVGKAAHEIGHALGLFHMQTRHDRDDFITLHTENLKDDWLSQHTKQTERTNYNYNLTYDFGSIMHYAATGSSKNRKPVLVPHDVNYLTTLGSSIVSFYDKLMINLHYGCLDKCNASSSAACQNGGYPHPRNCSRCICPSGFGGKLCNKRPSGCGETLTATTSYQTLESKVGEKLASEPSDKYTMCNYWIQAPAGSGIELVLDSYSLGMNSEGCPYAAVEIKAGSDKRLTGYRFCSPQNAGTTLISAYNIVPIITYSKFREAKTVLRYRIAPSGPQTSTPRPTFASTTPTTTIPEPICEDTSLCPSLVRSGFCHSPKYDDEIRGMFCPVSCGLCP